MTLREALPFRVARSRVAPPVILLGLTLLVGALAPRIEAQSLQERVEAAGDSDVIVVFPVREGVTICSGPRGSFRVERWNERRIISRPGSSCRADSAAVTLRVEPSGVTRVDLDTPEAAASDPDATRMAATGLDAAGFLLSLVESSEVREDADEAISAAALARDTMVWPDLLALARDPSRPGRVRESALLHVGQIAAAESLAPLTEIATDPEEDDGVRSSAVFALSELPDNRGVDALIQVAESPTTAAVRRAAFFWLAESDDPRVPAFFERVLTAGR